MTNSLEFDDIDGKIEMEITWKEGAVYLTKNNTELKISIEIFNRIIETFPILLDNGYT